MQLFEFVVGLADLLDEPRKRVRDVGDGGQQPGPELLLKVLDGDPQFVLGARRRVRVLDGGAAVGCLERRQRFGGGRVLVDRDPGPAQSTTWPIAALFTNVVADSRSV